MYNEMDTAVEGARTQELSEDFISAAAILDSFLSL
jgi:hypothetical protein